MVAPDVDGMLPSNRSEQSSTIDGCRSSETDENARTHRKTSSSSVKIRSSANWSPGSNRWISDSMRTAARERPSTSSGGGTESPSSLIGSNDSPSANVMTKKG